jgi:pyruvate/2-oxoglutarate/acetoin dehydrogenase E1 component/TPP-dependent pyruvate/acetoin dehydrogenase alpha subunit
MSQITKIPSERTANNQTDQFRQNVIDDYRICLISREASLLGRKEVLTGKAKFGILGDGKELPQVAMARAFQKGDWRSGYYRDQTFMLATGLSSVEDFFFQLYADAENDPFSGGRQMNSHYATPTIDKDGKWLDLTDRFNVSADVSCTAGQMARSLGIAMASKKFRKLQIEGSQQFSDNGNEVSFVTIGDSSTSEGVFWETINAAAIMKVPLVVAVWDDGYGISVPVEMQTVKGSISKALEGFLIDKNGQGIYIYTVKGWDYPELCAVFEKVTQKVRDEHIPAVIHVTELTQPQGHSTSGSHERYKTAKRLEWEKDFDCIRKMGEWMTAHNIVSQDELEVIQQEAKDLVKSARDRAWKIYSDKIRIYSDELAGIFRDLGDTYKTEAIRQLETEYRALVNPVFSEVVQISRKLEIQLKRFSDTGEHGIKAFNQNLLAIGSKRYNTHLYSQSEKAAINVPVVPASYSDQSPTMNGYQILNNYFDQILENNPFILAFGEDVGQIGDVNQGFAGLQLKYGKERVFDTGIREWTIIGQAIGGAMRGLRPIAEIQYLDYMAYAFSPLSDDLATLRYRSNGIQCAPAIIRSRGHRLEGIWHAGSPMGMIINAMQGIYLCVPRNMVQAAGMYNTLLNSDDPGIVIECLNGYRLKEKLPDNILEFTVPLGVPEILIPGSDVTLVTYGSCVREAMKGVDLLKGFNISVELIDAQTLMPFDLEGIILKSLQKTGRIVFMDEDIPGGATAYMMRHVLEVQNGYRFLDSKPVCLTAAEHRTPFGSDGDYFTKPYAEDVFDVIYDIMKECRPDQYS